MHLAVPGPVISPPLKAFQNVSPIMLLIARMDMSSKATVMVLSTSLSSIVMKALSWVAELKDCLICMGAREMGTSKVDILL